MGLCSTGRFHGERCENDGALERVEFADPSTYTNSVCSVGSAGIQLCERVYFDVIGRLELRVLPRMDALDDGEDANAPRWREPARRIEALLESPDRAQDLRSWLIAFVRDLLEMDTVAVYTRRTRGGDLYALELVDGSTIKPLIDASGHAPRPPDSTRSTRWTTCARRRAPTASMASRAWSASCYG